MLIDLFRYVQADFRASGCPAKVLFGQEHIAENAEPNRVVFVPSTDASYEPPVPSTGGTNGANPRPFLQRPAGCDLHIWGAANQNDLGVNQLAADYDVLNALINQTALSIYRAAGLGKVARFLGGGHTTKTLIVRRGLVYVMRIQLTIPLVEIDFPCGCIDTSVFTWLTQADVTADVTVNMLTAAVPTGTVMSSMNFLVNEDT